MTRVAALLLALLLALPGVALADQVRGVDVQQLERELNCPTCKAPLAVSNSPAADRIKQRLRELVAEGRTEEQIKDALVKDFGRQVLAAPPKKGFDLFAWVVPALAVLLGLAAIPFITRHWAARGRTLHAGAAGVDASPDELDRLEAELRGRDGERP